VALSSEVREDGVDSCVHGEGRETDFELTRGQKEDLRRRGELEKTSWKDGNDGGGGGCFRKI